MNDAEKDCPPSVAVSECVPDCDESTGTRYVPSVRSSGFAAKLPPSGWLIVADHDADGGR